MGFFRVNVFDSFSIVILILSSSLINGKAINAPTSDTSAKELISNGPVPEFIIGGKYTDVDALKPEFVNSEDLLR